MPIDNTIALQAKAPDQMQALSGMLTAASGAQTVQNNQMSLQERQGISQFMANPDNYLDKDGNVDFNKAAPGIMSVAPTTGGAHLQALMTAQKQHTEATSELSKLDDDNRTRIGNALATIPPDAPADVVNGTIDTLAQKYNGRIDKSAALMKKGYAQAVQGGPQQVAQFLNTASRSVLPQDTQQTMATPSGVAVSDNSTSRVVSTKPGTSVPVGQPIPGTTATMKLGPGNLESTESDSQGNRFVVTRSPQGTVLGTRPLDSVGAAPSTAPAPGPFRLPPGETGDTLKQVQGIRMNANQAARTVPEQQFNSNQIIKLADETNTGKGAQIAAGFKGGFAGIPWTSDAASNYNQLGHYMALQTSQLAQSAGIGGTDAGRSIASEQAGTREWTRDAIKSTARVNRALSTGSDLFNRGVESAVQGGNPFAARDFQNQWSKVASVDAIRFYDAARNKAEDPEGLRQVVHELGGVGSPKYKATLKKIDEMRNLLQGQQ